ncbi:GTP-binding protein [Weizmannia acidilactici]|uniref:GTP-binding protein n=1 Tax=Weizmannia acidilactici TaxID=2607726 RepID=A0A5J4JM66_9BACI|nr:GTP-binding protein [Weizmannia acidilactici]GER66787.1 GTP-binding protein [Weizmannia acidilactici]GER71775.1 GTP-binding protein [Weizmannia acidilactici]
MKLEDQFVNKSYYETFIKEGEERHPLEVLGEAFVEENALENSDLSYIRFAQGEVYFHYKDYEAAVFKWESIHNDFEPWAQKNMGDAYFELGLTGMAEEIYKTIQTDSMILKTEVALQLISLYIEEQKHEQAVQTIKQTVAMNPDYPNVTKIARAYFEKNEDWMNAVELAVNESVRTESLFWFEVLKSYIEKGYTKTISPDYFREALAVLYKVDQIHFEQMAAALWRSYQTESCYLEWLREFNVLFAGLDIHSFETWHELSAIYQETYLSLIGGNYLLKQLTPIMPGLLTNWLRITDSGHALLASSAVLAWNDLFSAGIEPDQIADAETILYRAEKTIDQLEYPLELLDSIIKWAKLHGLSVSTRLKWMARELIDFDVQHILVAGMNGSGKTAFIQSVLADSLPEKPTQFVMAARHGDHHELAVISDGGISAITEEDSQQLDPDAILEWRGPSQFLKENALVFLDTPGLNGSQRSKVYEYLHFADGLLFVLNANDPLTVKETDVLLKIKEQVPDLKIHFLMSKMDMIYSKQEAADLVEETAQKIKRDFPQAELHPYSSHYAAREAVNGLAQFFRKNFKVENLEAHRIEKLVRCIRESITYLLKQRLQNENELVESIHRHEDMLAKLNGAANQLEDVIHEQIQLIRSSYHSMTKSIKEELQAKIPDILRKSSDYIKLNSDFRKIHLELNEEMNNRIRSFLQTAIFPKYYELVTKWIADSESELQQSQAYLGEMAEGFNQLYGENIIALACDFKIMDDWRRDADRMANGVHFDSVNILLRHTPSQVLLKSAGKLLGALSQNKAMLYNRYKKFIESEDYQDIAGLITNKVMLQFELFEQGLERDIRMFFKNPETVLRDTITETETVIDESKEKLSNMKENPEVYQDPLKLFELKLRQFEWMQINTKARQKV